MMKKFFVFAALAVASWLGAVDTALLKFVPDKAAAVALVDVAKVSRHPQIKAALENPDAIGAFQALGIAPKDVRDVVGFYIGDDFGVIVRVADGKALRAKLDASPMIKTGNTAVMFAAMDVNGVRVYRCSVQGKNEAVLAAFVASDVVAFANSDAKLEKYLNAPKFDASRTFPGAAKAAVWGIYDNPDVKADSEEGQILSIEATLDVVGEESHDVVIAAVLNCDRDEYAMQLGMMAQMFFPVGCGAIFSDNPELAQKLMEMFRCKTSGKSLRVSLRITPEIARGLSAFAARSAQELVVPTGNGPAFDGIPALE